MLKNILQMILLAVCLLSPCYAKGETLTAEEARAVAADFFRKGNNARLADAGSLSLAHVENFGGSPGYYVFNAADSQGFIIISAGNPAGLSDTPPPRHGNLKPSRESYHLFLKTSA